MFYTSQKKKRYTDLNLDKILIISQFKELIVWSSSSFISLMKFIIFFWKKISLVRCSISVSGQGSKMKVTIQSKKIVIVNNDAYQEFNRDKHVSNLQFHQMLKTFFRIKPIKMENILGRGTFLVPHFSVTSIFFISQIDSESRKMCTVQFSD